MAVDFEQQRQGALIRVSTWDIFWFGGTVGVAVGGWVGFHLGNWTAAARAARATYRTQRGR